MVASHLFRIAVILLIFSSISASAQSTPADLLQPVHEAIVADDFQKAQTLLFQASRANRGNSAVQAEITQLRREIGMLEERFKDLEQERGVLESSPDDPGASQALGEYYAFMKGDWERGLTLLSHGDEEEIKAAATFDLANPTEQQARLEAGDLWQRVADSARETSRISRASLRARHWYLQAAESASTESELATIARRLDSLAFYPSKIVIFNAHNGEYDDRGVLLAEIKLLLDGKVVYKRRSPLAWQKSVSVPTIIRVPRNRADAVQVDVLKFYRSGGALAEIEVYQDGVDLTRGMATDASASFDAEEYPHSNLTDGDYGNPRTQDGIWVLPDKTLGWAHVVLDRPQFDR